MKPVLATSLLNAMAKISSGHSSSKPVVNLRETAGDLLALGQNQWFEHGLIGRSASIDSLRRIINKAAHTPFPIMLLGESGTGKEVVARAVHNASLRSKKPFVVVDCGSLVGSLMESDLFGHVKGAFSSANSNKTGLVELAAGGTLFLDEIGELPMELQTKLLRLTQEGEYRPVGALHSRKVELRFIAATNRNLRAEVRAGRFRLDLFHRLNVIPIHLPALRERKEDIPLLVNHFLQELEPLELPALRLSEGMLDILTGYSWPGNVRELKHCIERMVAMEIDCVPGVQDVLSDSSEMETVIPEFSEKAVVPGLSSPLNRNRREVVPIREIERQTIADALTATGGKRAEAAGLLRISRTTLYRRMRDYGATTEAFSY
jgi:transcriptional regulator with GAF, ATPase, and Fis domain